MADESRVNEAAPGVVETTDRGLFDFMKKKEDVAKPSDHDTMVSGVEKAHISEPEYRKEEEKHESLLEKLKHSDNSSSSDEEDDEEKKRRKRERKEKKKGGLKEKFDEKFGHKEVGQHHDEHHQYGDTNVPIEKVHHEQENVYSEPSYVAHPPQQHHEPTTYVEHPQHFESSHVAPPQHTVNDHVHQEAEHKKQEGGFMDKVKDKLPGHKDEAETKTEAAAAVPVSAHHGESHVEGEKDKKGFLDKIKDKIPGFHSKTDAEEKKDLHDEEKKEGGHY